MKQKEKIYNFFKYIFHYSAEERGIVWIILLLAIIGTIIYIEPIFWLPRGHEFWQALWDKFAIFFITTLALTVFLKRFFDNVDRRKFHSNLKMLCISHKMHEVILFSLEYFDKFSFLLGENKKFKFQFQQDILSKLHFLSEISKQEENMHSVDDFWHNSEYKKLGAIRKLLSNQDFFYKTGKDAGRFDLNKKKTYENISKKWTNHQKIFLELLQKVFFDPKLLDSLRLNEFVVGDKWKDTQKSSLSKKWYIWNHTTLEEAKTDTHTLVWMVEYLRMDIYKKIYEYSDRKSADGMDAFLKLTTVLDRIDWKINIKNKDKAEKEERYVDLFIGLEDDFAYLFSIAFHIYAIKDMFLESYASYEELLLKDTTN